MRFFSGIRHACLWLLRKLMFVWVRTRVLPDPVSELGLTKEQHVAYVLDVRGLSNLLVVEEVCERLGLPRPLSSPRRPEGLPRMVFLREMRGLWARRIDPRVPPGLDLLYHHTQAAASPDVLVVPVSIFWGRSPDKESSSLKILFSDSWSVVGRLRKMLTILLHGRTTLVQFSTPVHLSQLADEGLDFERAQRKLSRVLRVHFRRRREATIGPDLSHRRNLVEELLSTPAVREEITNQAVANGWSEDKSRAKARHYAKEIAADYSYPVIRFFDIFLSWLWNKLYRGIEFSHFSTLQDVTAGNEVIYVPCHRSHMDYLLLSYLLYHRGLVPPHIAAGVNLNLPLVGSLLRRSGAFFIRRSFKGNRLYAKIFDAYMRRNIARGVSLEYFIEGTRSRTGRLLAHKGGLLAMTVQSYLKDQQRPVVFVPIYIGYEKLAEGRSYLRELGGKPKKSESLTGVLRAAKLLRQDFGRVHVNIGEPIFLEEILDRSAPNWRERDYHDDYKPEFMKSLVDDLGNDILRNINRAAAVTPVNLLAVALLATAKQAMPEADLVRQIDLYLSLLRKVPYSPMVTLPQLDGAGVIQYGEELGVIARRSHALGDILALEGANAVLMTYARNNVLHLLALPSLIACCFLDNKEMEETEIHRLCRLAFPFVKSELFVALSDDAFSEQISRMIGELVGHGLLIRDENSPSLRRAPSRSFAAVQLSVLAQSLLQTVERYYLVLAVLLKHGSGVLPQKELETECQQVAERMSMLHQLDAPEFFDRRLFKGFIERLKESGVVHVSDEGCLVFDEQIRTVESDARRVLSDRIRHSILQVTHA
ncbi:MAG: glycerol-3-phosphate 1-O-acyltransferase PlsB [Gammaproteobacteria bacterium]